MVLVNELPEPDLVPLHQSTKIKRTLQSKNEKDREGPLAEALLQNDKIFHNLKILKSSPSEIQNNRQSVPVEDAKSAKLNKEFFYSQVRINDKMKSVQSIFKTLINSFNLRISV